MGSAYHSFHHGELSDQILAISHRLNREAQVVRHLRADCHPFTGTRPERNHLAVGAALPSHDETPPMLKSLDPSYSSICRHQSQFSIHSASSAFDVIELLLESHEILNEQPRLIPGRIHF